MFTGEGPKILVQLQPPLKQWTTNKPMLIICCNGSVLSPKFPLSLPKAIILPQKTLYLLLIQPKW